VFAFFAAGVTVGGLSGLGDSLTDRVALGIIAGLVVGKVVGILGATWLLARFTRAQLDPNLRWVDMAGVSLLAGIGFTVSLLIGELAFGAGSPRDEHVKVGVLTASLLAASLAAVILVFRNRAYRRIEAAEAVDSDGDGIPDAYQR
jgi:NhaA family Na+:H+ antiporter